MKLQGIAAIRVQESVFAGVWLMVGASLDRVTIAPVPSVAPQRAHIPHSPAIGVLARRVPGLANAPTILAESIDKSLN